MNGRKWLGAALALTAVVATQALGGASAEASARSFGAARIAPARDASAAPGIVLAGLTSQQYPVFFKISDDGRTLTAGAIALNMTCTSGVQFVPR